MTGEIEALHEKLKRLLADLDATFYSLTLAMWWGRSSPRRSARRRTGRTGAR
jgi:hypothetical protein